MSLTIRAYNVLFGDCLLVTWDEHDGSKHHAWIDFGNMSNDANTPFEPIYDQILALTDGHLDLVVITHRHMDHLEGFYSLRRRFAEDFQIDRLWYAHVDPTVDDQFALAENALRARLPLSLREGDGDAAQLFLKNFGVQGLTILDRMEEILDTLPAVSHHAVHRETDVDTVKPPGMQRLEIEILAPEKDSSAYLQDSDDESLAGSRLSDYLSPGSAENADAPSASTSVLPPGQRAENSKLSELADFARLRRKLRARGALDLLRAADKTRNNTSVALRLRYGDSSVLLPGDAEHRSWELMDQKPETLRADVIKIAHHGSINASPDWSYQRVMPHRRARNAAILSTDPSRYPPDKNENEVPHEDVVRGWSRRLTQPSRLARTDEVAASACVVVEVADTNSN